MTPEINESDWKIFRRLHEVELERFCQRVIGEIKQASGDCDRDYHKRYLKIFTLIMDRNDEIARSFDDVRRSRAMVLLTNIRKNGLLTDEEFSQLSPEARARVESILEVRRP
jgi:hypothetical protein